MQCYHCAKGFVDRDEFENHRQSHIDRQRELQRGITRDGPGDSNGRAGTRRPRQGILRATEVLLSLAGKSLKSSDETPSAIDSFQDALRLFPPYTEKDDGTPGMPDCRCPDCEAVFSSPVELKQHHLTKYCPGAAVVVYVMTRDRLINKGYRVEKKSVPLDAQPFGVPCGKCGEPFSSEDDRNAHRDTHKSQNLECVHCGQIYNTSYELDVHYDWHDDMEYLQLREVREDTASSNHSRSPSLASTTKTIPILSSAPAPGTETTITKKPSGILRAQRLRDSWPVRKYAQPDDGELVAISFSSPEDLERVHAPDGVLQEADEGSVPVSPVNQLVTIKEANTTAQDTTTVADAENKTGITSLCEEEGVQHMDQAIERQDGPSLGDSPAAKDNIISRKQSLFRSVFGRKISKRISQSSSASSSKKLTKKGTIRFSIVSNRVKNDGESMKSATTADEERSESRNGRDSPALKLRMGDVSDTDSGYGGSPRGNPGPFIHVRPFTEGAIASDASGRQRILSTEQVARIYLQISECLSSTTLKTTVGALQSRAEMAFKRGHMEAAIAEYHNALNILNETPALDIDRLSRAAILHELGRAYENLSQPAESEACYLEALGLYKRTFGRDHSKNCAILHDLGTLCEKDGYATEAAELYERSLAGRLKILGQNAPETLSSMQDLATIKTSLGDLETAVLLFEMVIPSLETVLGLQNENTLTAMDNLSMLYQKLGLNEESRAISRKMIPHCKSVFGIDSSMTRDAVAKYVQNSDNFDFSPDVKEILDHYRRSRQPQSLRVLQGLGRAYMDAGLNRDAAELFELLFEDFTAVKGVDAAETIDALSALCVSREHLDALDKAVQAYGQLIQIARKTPPDHHSRRRMDYAQKRVADLSHRQDVLLAEKKAWGLDEEGPCGNCKYSTSNICSACHIVRYCCDACRNLNSPAHEARCVPSITLRESKSIAIKPKCPSPIQDHALAKVTSKDGITTPSVTASYTFYLDPRSFTTFRMRLSSTVNTLVLFSTDTSIQYTLLDNTPPEPGSPAAGSSTSPKLPQQSPVEWTTPQTQEYLFFSPKAHSTTTYLLIAPGREILKAQVDKRVRTRGGGGDRERFEALTVPDKELIEYSQGLLLNGYMGEAFMYVLEWI